MADEITIRYTPSGTGQIAYGLLALPTSGADHLLLLNDSFSPVDDMLSHPVPARFAKRLAGMRRLVFVNLRGFGHSDPLDDPARYPEAHAEDFVAVIDALGVEAVDVFTQGWTSNVAIRAACRFPDRIRSLCSSTRRCAPSGPRTTPTPPRRRSSTHWGRRWPPVPCRRRTSSPPWPRA